MKCYLLVLLLLSSLLSHSQSYKLDILMKPSFMEKAHFTLSYNGKEASYLRIENAYFDVRSVVPQEYLVDITAFLDTFKFTKTNNVRKITSIKNGDTTTMSIVGFDGITVKGHYASGQECSDFEFWSPRVHTDNYKLMKLFFEIVDQSFLEQKEHRYINGLKGYFKDISSTNYKDSSHVEFYTKQDVYKVVEKMPEFRGGKEKLQEYLHSKMAASDVISNAKNTGKVFVEFIIDEEGGVTESKVLKNINASPDVAKACVEIITRMPDWVPGEQYDKKVKVSYRIPFRINVK